MNNDISDYLQLLKNFLQKSACFLYQHINKKDYIISSNSIHLDEYIKMDIKELLLNNFRKFSSLSFGHIEFFEEEQSETNFYAFLSQDIEYWNLFFKYHPSQETSFFITIQYVPDNLFYTCMENIKIPSLLNINEYGLKILFNKIKNCSEPINEPVIYDFFYKSHEQITNPSILVALIHEVQDFPQKFKDELYKKIHITSLVKSLNIEQDFIVEIPMLSFSFDRVQFLHYLTSYFRKIKESSDNIYYPLITEQTIVHAFNILSQFFPRAFLAPLSDYNEDHTLDFDDYEFHIDFSQLETIAKFKKADKLFLKEFIKKAIFNIIERSMDSHAKEEHNTQEQLFYLNKLYDVMYLEKIHPLKNQVGKLNTNLSKI